MSAQSLAATSSALSWAEICQQYPNEWVCLLDIDHELDGSIRSALLISHDRSIVAALDRLGTSKPDTTVVHTWGHPLQTPRIEIVNESRDLVRSRR
ncbi:MAG TPA: hypothetical protein VNO30_06570 [Kofleriaceae bacterium]|nr:hypothetical protein [Kofleriaceae bacterium]